MDIVFDSLLIILIIVTFLKITGYKYFKNWTTDKTFIILGLVYVIQRHKMHREFSSTGGGYGTVNVDSLNSYVDIDRMNKFLNKINEFMNGNVSGNVKILGDLQIMNNLNPRKYNGPSIKNTGTNTWNCRFIYTPYATNADKITFFPGNGVHKDTGVKTKIYFWESNLLFKCNSFDMSTIGLKITKNGPIDGPNMEVTKGNKLMIHKAGAGAGESVALHVDGSVPQYTPPQADFTNPGQDFVDDAEDAVNWYVDTTTSVENTVKDFFR